MPSLNFQKQFAPLVESGEKRQTIRAMRKRPFKEDDTLYLYTGLRTRHTKKIGEYNVDLLREVKFDRKTFAWLLPRGDWWSLGAGVMADKIAEMDGFEDYQSLCDWFEKAHGLPFHGQLIRW